MIPSWMKRPLCFLATLIVVTAAALAQSERGTVSGTVRDATGAAVPAARIVIKNNATNQSTELTTNESGEFAAPDIAVGTYTVRAEKGGFR
ncbi:MAG: carboxypeptidase-like regulatory domain-containing protein, partial [Bryobacteraceae bacterium]